MKLMEKDTIGLFDFLKSVSDTKENLVDHDEFEKKYSPFMLNRFLSVQQDTTFFANIMSQFPHLPKKLQYLFFLYGIDKKKRYFQYAGKGKDKSKHLGNIVKYYQCSKEQAVEYLELLSDEQLKKIKSMFDKRTTKGK